MPIEQLQFDPLFRWFVGLQAGGRVWDETVFSKNRDRLLEAEIARAFFNEVLVIARDRSLLSNQHFTVDGTLIEAWAGQKSFQKRDEDKKSDDDDPGNPTVNFKGERRSNSTHGSKTDWEARLYRESHGDGSRLCFMGHVLMENRNGLAVDGQVTPALGRSEREAALTMADRLSSRRGRRTLGADKGYDAREFASELRERDIAPHIAQVESRRSSVDGRATRHAGYEMSQRKLFRFLGLLRNGLSHELEFSAVGSPECMKTLMAR